MPQSLPGTLSEDKVALRTKNLGDESEVGRKESDVTEVTSPLLKPGFTVGPKQVLRVKIAVEV